MRRPYSFARLSRSSCSAERGRTTTMTRPWLYIFAIIIIIVVFPNPVPRIPRIFSRPESACSRRTPCSGVLKCAFGLPKNLRRSLRRDGWTAISDIDCKLEPDGAGGFGKYSCEHSAIASFMVSTVRSWMIGNSLSMRAWAIPEMLRPDNSPNSAPKRK